VTAVIFPFLKQPKVTMVAAVRKEVIQSPNLGFSRNLLPPKNQIKLKRKMVTRRVDIMVRPILENLKKQ